LIMYGLSKKQIAVMTLIAVLKDQPNTRDCQLPSKRQGWTYMENIQALYGKDNVARASLSRTFKRLRKRGLIEVIYHLYYAYLRLTPKGYEWLKEINKEKGE